MFLEVDDGKEKCLNVRTCVCVAWLTATLVCCDGLAHFFDRRPLTFRGIP